MEETNQCCLSCLCTGDEFNIKEFAIQCEPHIAIFQVDKLSLCYVCTRLLQHTETFVKNVQSNQILLQNLHEGIQSIQSIWPQVQPSMTLSLAHLPSIEVTCSDDEKLSVFSSKDLEICQDMEISQNKGISLNMEIKPEMKEDLDQSEEIFVGSDDLQDSMKEEENFPLNSLKEEFELELDIIDLKEQSLRKTLKSKQVKKNKESMNAKEVDLKEQSLRKTLKSKQVKKNKESMNAKEVDLKEQSLRKTLKSKQVKKNKESMNAKDQEMIKGCPCTKVHISDAQGIAEYAEQRAVRAQDPAYLSSEYRCEKCAQGFVVEHTYNTHLAWHSSSRGDFECNICTLWFKTEDKLTTHKEKHTLRYKCPQCDLTCASFTTIIVDCYTRDLLSKYDIKEHFKAQHTIEFKCPQCSKVFARRRNLRVHKKLQHSGRSKVCCDHCHKTYAQKQNLRDHIMRKHSLVTTHAPVVKRHRCEECGSAFQTASLLKLHALKHSDLRPFYCVECDKLHCDHCDKRFALKSSLSQHINKVHLKICPRPYSCDKCDKTYVRSGSLLLHKRYTHEGLKRPLRYPCPMCDKVFITNAILKSHKRTHTGERPFQCSRCPAAFTQSSILNTHVRLVHLKLTRNGRPKTSPNT